MKYMSANIHIMKASGTLDKYEPLFRRYTELTLSKVQEKVRLPGLDIVIDDDVSSAIPETGIGGFAPSGHLLYIHVDATRDWSEENLISEFQSTLAHELHHCARWIACGYGKTLLETTVSEGLADHFDIEINGGHPKPWSIAVKAGDLEEVRKRADEDFFNANYHHSAWFFGSETEKLPRWAGYSLGFAIVGEYIKNTGRQASDLVAEPAENFIA